VDDFIPIWKESNLPCYADKKTNNIWPMLLEKAWAKLNGSYEATTRGTISQAMSLLLPFPNEIDIFEDSEEDAKRMRIGYGTRLTLKTLSHVQHM